MTQQFGHWKEQTSRSGKVYYYNSLTQQSQWAKPQEWREHDKMMEAKSGKKDEKPLKTPTIAPPPVPPEMLHKTDSHRLPASTSSIGRQDSHRVPSSTPVGRQDVHRSTMSATSLIPMGRQDSHRSTHTPLMGRLPEGYDPTKPPPPIAHQQFMRHEAAIKPTTSAHGHGRISGAEAHARVVQSKLENGMSTKVAADPRMRERPPPRDFDRKPSTTTDDANEPVESKFTDAELRELINPAFITKLREYGLDSEGGGTDSELRRLSERIEEIDREIVETIRDSVTVRQLITSSQVERLLLDTRAKFSSKEADALEQNGFF